MCRLEDGVGRVHPVIDPQPCGSERRAKGRQSIHRPGEQPEQGGIQSGTRQRRNVQRQGICVAAAPLCHHGLIARPLGPVGKVDGLNTAVRLLSL